LEREARSTARLGSSVKIERLSSRRLREQTRAQGPTWLDREILSTETPSRPALGDSTFETRLKAAARARLTRLKDRGYVSPEATHLDAKGLQRLERDARQHLAARLSAQHGRFLEAPTSFTGRVLGFATVGEVRHAVIAEGGQFTLVPATGHRGRTLERSIGERVGIERARGQALTITRGLDRALGLELTRGGRSLGR